MNVPLWVWALTIAAFGVIMVVDFFTHVRTPHEPSFREASLWSGIYVTLALLFGVGMMLAWGTSHGAEFLAGYVTEWSLSVDNLFVFLIIMTKFAVPRIYQQKVLMVGVIIALVLRGMFILAGAAAIARFEWVFYLFGAFLIYTAIALAREDHDSETEFHENRLLRLVRRAIPSTSAYHGDRLTVRSGSRRLMTPMLVVMIAIGSTDVLFALDSIPAIFGLTKEPYIVFTTNAFALLGLRQLYFLLHGLLRRLVFLSEGLAVILAFIGIKLVLETLHGNDLPFVNGGKPVAWAPEIPIWLSLLVIVVSLTVATAASLAKTRRDAAATAVAPAVTEV